MASSVFFKKKLYPNHTSKLSDQMFVMVNNITVFNWKKITQVNKFIYFLELLSHQQTIETKLPIFHDINVILLIRKENFKERFIFIIHKF